MAPASYGGLDVDLITGPETFPTLTSRGTESIAAPLSAFALRESMIFYRNNRTPQHLTSIHDFYGRGRGVGRLLGVGAILGVGVAQA